MRFKIDENLPVEVAELLRRLGHDATTILEQLLVVVLIPRWHRSANKNAAFW